MEKDKKINIILQSIGYDTTCKDMNIPLQLARDHCQKELDPLTNTRKRKSQKRRLLTTNNRCKQLWDIRWADSPTLHKKHNLVRRFLKLKIHQEIQYISLRKIKKQ